MTWTKQIRTIVMLMLVMCMTAVDLSVAKPKPNKDKKVPSGTPRKVSGRKEPPECDDITCQSRDGIE